MKPISSLVLLALALATGITAGCAYDPAYGGPGGYSPVPPWTVAGSAGQSKNGNNGEFWDVAVVIGNVLGGGYSPGFPGGISGHHLVVTNGTTAPLDIELNGRLVGNVSPGQSLTLPLPVNIREVTIMAKARGPRGEFLGYEERRFSPRPGEGRYESWIVSYLRQPR